MNDNYHSGGNNSFRQDQGPSHRFNNRDGQRGNSMKSIDAQSKFAELKFDETWIKIGATADMVSYAEKCGLYMKENNLTNSKIRSVYGEMKRIQMGTYDKNKSSFYLLKPKVAYAVGRDAEKSEGLKLFKLIFDKASQYVSDQKTYDNFCNFVEAILAYHRSFGGK